MAMCTIISQSTVQAFLSDFGNNAHFCLYPRVSQYRGLSILTSRLIRYCFVNGSSFHISRLEGTDFPIIGCEKVQRYSVFYIGIRFQSVVQLIYGVLFIFTRCYLF